MSKRLALLAAGLLAATGAHAAPQTVERSYYLMGTMLMLSIEARDRPTGLRASDAVQETIARDERRLSTWNEDSELSRLNRAPIGKPIPLSPLLRRDLDGARRYAK